MNISKVFSILISGIFILLIACQKEPSAAFNTSKIFALPNESITFTNLTTDADHYQWDFGDGNICYEKNPEHYYTVPGDYLVILYAFSKNGNKSNLATQNITIGLSPSCALTYSPRFPKPGESVHFLDNSTNNPTSWLWDFGDGTTSTEKNPNHLFVTEKKYNLTLTVTNNFCSFRQTDTIFVLNQSPVMPTAKFSFSFSPFFLLNFLDESTGNPTSWFWNFGDGTTSRLQNPSHQYLQGGFYYVTLRVFNLAGSHQITKMVNIPSTLPEAGFIYSEGENYTIYFQDMTTNNPNLWDWSFGDGSNSDLQNPTHQYLQSNTYSVTLKVSNNAGTDQITQLVDVSNGQYTFFIGNYNVLDEDVGFSVSYTDQITASELPKKFFTNRFANYENAYVYFLVNGTTINVPSQTIHCGTPPNETDHTFIGSGYFVHTGNDVKIFIDYTDFSILGTFKHTGKYTKIN